jgi:hypothetical protein
MRTKFDECRMTSIAEGVEGKMDSHFHRNDIDCRMAPGAADDGSELRWVPNHFTPTIVRAGMTYANEIQRVQDDLWCGWG